MCVPAASYKSGFRNATSEGIGGTMLGILLTIIAVVSVMALAFKVEPAPRESNLDFLFRRTALTATQARRRYEALER